MRTVRSVVDDPETASQRLYVYICIYVYTCVCMCVSVRMEELRGLQRHLRSFDGMKVLENIKHVYIVRVIIHLFIFINSRRQRR